MKVLVTGASGQLAKAFIDRFNRTGTAYCAPSESALNITSPESVEDAVATHRPNVILNCAAYNNVDAAETSPGVAFAVNRDAVAILADVARRYHARLVHYSSDYVFDGKAKALYSEDDATAPLNQYGASKLEGEKIAMAATPGSLLFRVSWVFGNGNQNFFHKMLAWSESNKVLNIVWDQISIPTYTEDIVSYTLKALDHGLEGCWHLTNSGYASRYETARFFFKCLKRDAIILPVCSDSFPSPAKRPFFSAMHNGKLSAALNADIPAWEDAVERFTQQLLKNI